MRDYSEKCSDISFNLCVVKDFLYCMSLTIGQLSNGGAPVEALSTMARIAGEYVETASQMCENLCGELIAEQKN